MMSLDLLAKTCLVAFFVCACYLFVGLIFKLPIILSAVYETVKVKIEVEWTPELQTHHQNNDSTSFLSQQFESEVRSDLEAKHYVLTCG